MIAATLHAILHDMEYIEQSNIFEMFSIWKCIMWKIAKAFRADRPNKSILDIKTKNMDNSMQHAKQIYVWTFANLVTEFRKVNEK